jgi:hypothetical protein
MDWFDADEIAAFHRDEYDVRQVGRPAKGESPKVVKKRTEKRRKAKREMERQKAFVTDKSKTLDVQAQLLSFGRDDRYEEA